MAKNADSQLAVDIYQTLFYTVAASSLCDY